MLLLRWDTFLHSLPDFPFPLPIFVLALAAMWKDQRTDPAENLFAISIHPWREKKVYNLNVLYSPPKDRGP